MWVKCSSSIHYLFYSTFITFCFLKHFHCSEATHTDTRTHTHTHTHTHSNTHSHTLTHTLSEEAPWESGCGRICFGSFSSPHLVQHGSGLCVSVCALCVSVCALWVSVFASVCGRVLPFLWGHESGSTSAVGTRLVLCVCVCVCVCVWECVSVCVYVWMIEFYSIFVSLQEQKYVLEVT